MIGIRLRFRSLLLRMNLIRVTSLKTLIFEISTLTVCLGFFTFHVPLTPRTLNDLYYHETRTPLSSLHHSGQRLTFEKYCCRRFYGFHPGTTDSNSKTPVKNPSLRSAMSGRDWSERYLTYGQCKTHGSKDHLR